MDVKEQAHKLINKATELTVEVAVEVDEVDNPESEVREYQEGEKRLTITGKLE